MKGLVVFLILASFSFSVFYEPPVANVSSFNGIRAEELSDSYNASAAQNDSVFIGWYGSLLLSANMRIAGLTLLIDNSTTAGKNSRVVVEKGGMMGHILRRGSSTLRCDRDFFDSYGDDALCTFDGDTCAEYEYSTDIFYTIEMTFVFRNLSETVRVPEETVVVFGEPFENVLANTVSIPEGIEQAMANASGGENLTVILNGTATFVYGLDNRSYGGIDCISRYSVASETIHFTDNRTYLVSGENTLIFTSAPVLNEQWFRNNRFDNVVLSQSRLYRAEILRNNASAVSFSMYGFNITVNPFGLREIVSAPLNDSSVYVGVVNVTPAVLDRSTQTYAFLYQFNYSYEGLGENVLMLRVKDVFGREANISQKITSRQLSYHSNKTELGGEYDPATARKSAAVTVETLRFVEIGLGMLGILVILLLINQIRK